MTALSPARMMIEPGAAGLETAVLSALDCGAPLELDLSPLHTLDSATLARLVAAHKSLTVAGGRLDMYCPAGEVARTLRAIGLFDRLAGPRPLARPG